MARAVLTPTDKAVLAMTSTEYLTLLGPEDADGALSTICSPVSATSTFSSIWSSRRPSSASDVSRATDHGDECGHGDEDAEHAKERQSPPPARSGPRERTPEALAVGACIVRRDPASSELGVVLSCPPCEVQQHKQGGRGESTYHQHLTPGLWHLPQSSVQVEDYSISAALARTVHEQTGLSVTRVVGTLDDTRHHLHHQRDIRALSLKTTGKTARSGGSDVSAEQDAADNRGLGIPGLDELMKMIDLSCAGAAASFAAAHAARRSRNVSRATVTDCCHVCDLASPVTPSDHGSLRRLQQHAGRRRRRTLKRRASRAAAYDERSDSCSSPSAGGYESNSDESTCRLLHGAQPPLSLETTAPQKRHRAGSRSASQEHPSVSYVPLAQEAAAAGEEQGAASGAARPATLESDSESSSASYDSLGDVKTYRECLQLNYIVLVDGTSDPAEATIVTEADVDECRMSPQTRDLVRQAFRWVKDHYSSSSGQAADARDHVAAEDTDEDLDMPAPLAARKALSLETA